ncbi:tRNA preQ1(34) S-adenosylmethionine ribosyltransferase-isomerase QueA [Sandaracinus amylolyticus]|uniref:S-adenosylmethionine:tRNA ribosyltransferase-isomerase n=1 Tax=Sandaracinus amylolyticus TaxID=927083 RepID=A0A0F6SG20_9BACT|nr:tRNA preQ1(34) S-adenosylmethionine ribosyltransferase-isomerase QueA [Sandaracinus amylolyticus]AKF07929.1 S-adenosylmethionine tRNA ribosyltransferase-isomerase [Sandaracinus amylolyticus]
MDARELDFDLPEDLIAQTPPAERDAARLLVLSCDTGAIEHRRVLDLPELLAPSLLVVNDTRVLPARLFATKPTGGRVEILLLERTSAPGTRESWNAIARGTKSLRAGMRLSIASGFDAEVIALHEGGELDVALSASPSVRDALAAHGHVPLPPYIRRADDASDLERYQTVFAKDEGSVAAPTAGLHFSDRLLAALDAAGHRIARVTLHVGPGTFAPLRTETLDEHVMHEERWEIADETARAIAEARAEGRPVVAIGTTVVRTLESACDEHGIVRAGAGRTRIFIRPPYPFRAIDALFTNFHLPRSTLLALVMAFAGIEPTRRAYREAVDQRYRFFSYGDAMLIRGKK